MTGRPAILDHIVVNTMHDMDGAAETFTKLGFRLTPRGHHSTGSINHLMMTSGAYLELVGVPRTGPRRQEIVNSPFGLNGLVLRSDDADETFARLTKAGFTPLPVSNLSRPVTIDGDIVDARFRLVRLPEKAFPAGRVYFCQHLTPGLVWRSNQLDHPNGFGAIDGLVVSSPDPCAEADTYAKLCGAQAFRDGNGWRIDLAAFSIQVIESVHPCFASVGLVFAQLDDLERRSSGLPGIEWRSNGTDEASLQIASLKLRLDCRSAS